MRTVRIRVNYGFRRICGTGINGSVLTKLEDRVMRVTICIGSACHLKGSREIIQRLQELVKEHGVSDKVDLNGAFCSGNCVNGVCVTVDGELFSLKPENTDDFFAKEILGRL